MMASKQQLVFLHYENPSVDSRKAEHRQTVAKFAMLNRQKNPPTTTAAPISPPVQRPLSPTYIDYTDDATNTSPEWNSTPATLSRLQSISSQASWSSDLSTPPSVAPSSSSPPESRSNSEGSIQYTAPQVFGEELTYNWAPLQPLDTIPFISNGDHPLDTIPFISNGDYYSSFHDTTQTIPLRPSGRIIEQDGEIQAESSKLAAKKRQGKKRHSQAKLAHSASASRQNAPGAVTRYQPSARSLVGGTPGDPFNSLPIPANKHTYELLYQYSNARLISSVYANGSPDTFERIKKMRQTVWAPLTRNSKPAMHALVAYVEATPGLPIRSRSHAFLHDHINSAVEGVRMALYRPEAATDDSLCFTVVLLMLIAQRLGYTEDYAMHANGLATLLSFRTEAITAHGETDDTVDRLRAFYITNPQDQCLYCRQNHEAAGSPPDAIVYDEHNFKLSRTEHGLELREMLNRGLLSPAMANFIEPAMIWSTLAERARKDKLSAAIGATHAWIDEGEVSLSRPILPLDTAIHISVQLCFYLSSWLDWQHSCSAVSRLAKAVHASLERADVDTFLSQCPDALLWMSLMAGPLCDGEPRAWLSVLLSRAAQALALNRWDFGERVDTFDKQFFWSKTLIPGAEVFWNETFDFLEMESNYSMQSRL